MLACLPRGLRFRLQLIPATRACDPTRLPLNSQSLSNQAATPLPPSSEMMLDIKKSKKQGLETAAEEKEKQRESAGSSRRKGKSPAKPSKDDSDEFFAGQLGNTSTPKSAASLRGPTRARTRKAQVKGSAAQTEKKQINDSKTSPLNAPSTSNPIPTPTLSTPAASSPADASTSQSLDSSSTGTAVEPLSSDGAGEAVGTADGTNTVGEGDANEKERAKAKAKAKAKLNATATATATATANATVDPKPKPKPNPKLKAKAKDDAVAMEDAGAATSSDVTGSPLKKTKGSPLQKKKARGSDGGGTEAATMLDESGVDSLEALESLPNGSSAEAYAKKLADVSMTLSAREEKLIRLTQENDEHSETQAILRSQIEQLELQLEDDQTSHLENLTEEFTERLGETESKLKDALRDRETARTQLAELTERYAADVGESGEQLTALEAEKDKKIAALTKEAQKLADSSFKSSQINKKLQKKVKEADEATKKLNVRIDEGQSTIDKLQGQLAEKAEAEKMHKKSATQVTAVSEQQSKELSSLKSKVKDLADKNGGLQSALDTAHKNNEGLQQDAAEAKAKASNAVQSAEVGAQESLKLELQRMEAETARVQEGLSSQVADLQAGLRRAEGQGARREDNLRKEIADLNDRLRLAEEREQQMTESLSQTTKPLVRQIDMLRQALQSQTSNHELAESTLSNRLQDAQSALVEAEGAEQVATERFAEMRIKFVALEEKHGKLRREHLEIRTEADSLRTTVEELEAAVKTMELMPDMLFAADRLIASSQNIEERIESGE